MTIEFYKRKQNAQALANRLNRGLSAGAIRRHRKLRVVRVKVIAPSRLEASGGRKYVGGFTEAPRYSFKKGEIGYVLRYTHLRSTGLRRATK